MFYAPPRCARVFSKEKKKKTGKKRKEKAFERGWRGKKPKGNGIKDSRVRVGGVYAVVFWLFMRAWALWGATLALLYLFNFMERLPCLFLLV